MNYICGLVSGRKLVYFRRLVINRQLRKLLSIVWSLTAFNEDRSGFFHVSVHP